MLCLWRTRISIIIIIIITNCSKALHSFFFIQPSLPIITITIAAATMLFSPLCCHCPFPFSVITLFIFNSRPPHSPRQFIEYRNDKAFTLTHTPQKKCSTYPKNRKEILVLVRDLCWSRKKFHLKIQAFISTCQLYHDFQIIPAVIWANAKVF